LKLTAQYRRSKHTSRLDPGRLLSAILRGLVFTKVPVRPPALPVR
jgi:hypothetical protein